jgi:hypothetical protein
MSPGPGGTNSGKLEGWLAIAGYFAITPRAAQTWEKTRGLPVHRVGGRVYAIPEELDQWRVVNDYSLSETPDSPAPLDIPTAESVDAAQPREREQAIESPPVDISAETSHSRTRGWVFLTASAIIVVAVAMGLYLILRPFRQPATWSAENRSIIVRDKDGNVAWTHELPHVLVQSVSSSTTGTTDRRGVLADLNSDGKNEFIFSYINHQGQPTFGTLIYGFSHSGEVLWTHKMDVNGLLNNGGVPIPGSFTPRYVNVLNRARPDGGRIVVAGNRGGGGTYLVEILRPDGAPVARYLHHGWLEACMTHDVDGDGWDEIVLGGVNNAYANEFKYSATLVVLDSRSVAGQGMVPRSESSRLFEGISQGAERAVLLFPNLAPYSDPNRYFRVVDLEVNAGNIELRVTNLERLFVHFYLDATLSLRHIVPNLEYSGMLFGKVQPPPPYDRQVAIVRDAIGGIRYLKNDFAGARTVSRR